MNKLACFNDLLGKTLVSIENKNNEELIFTTDNKEIYKLYHIQDCCEQVFIEDICGELDSLLNAPLLEAEVAQYSQDTNPPGISAPYYQDSFTWTFYKLRTRKGGVTIRWYGASNGYYSETVDFCRVA